MKTVVWSEQARADVRRLDRSTAKRIFAAVARFADTGLGDIKKLQGQRGELRLRVGHWRVRLIEQREQTLRILRVRHRSEAYR